MRFPWWLLAMALASCSSTGDSTGASEQPVTDAEPAVGRYLVVPDLADPDVLAIDDNHFVLSGTAPGNAFPLYESSDLVSWNKTGSYDPSAKDPDFDYCFLWAPDIVKDTDPSKLRFYFTAVRGPKGHTTCPPPPGTDVTTFRAVSQNGRFDFGRPEALFSDESGARTYPASGCPADGCPDAIRIDPTEFEGRLYYVYFQGGNNIASVALSDPRSPLIHAGPANFNENAFEENINEAPELLSANGKKYLFFSGGFFNSQYATYYVMGDRVEQLTRQLPLMRLTTPVRRKDGRFAETHGHNSIVKRRDKIVNFFHMGVFDDAGKMFRRDTWAQPIQFKGDGTANSQNEVQLTWNGIDAGYVYSVDAVLRSGEVVGHCIGADSIGPNTSATFVGICPDASDRMVHKSQVAAFRLYASQRGGPFIPVGNVDYDGFTDRVGIVAK